MPRANDSSEVAAQFDRMRPYMRALATRMLGSEVDAEDAVQETWLRLNRVAVGDIEDLRAWLTTVTSRVCLDMLRARRRRQELPVTVDLDDLLASSHQLNPRTGPKTPEDEVLLAESVGLAVHLMMDSLSPAERVAFVLHDIFDLPFSQVAEVLGRSMAAVKMLASRARGRIRLVSPTDEHETALDREIIDAFFAAARSGDLTELLTMLAPEVELHAVTSDGTTVIQGAVNVAGQAKLGAHRGVAAARPMMCPVTAAGRPGVLIMIDGRPSSLMLFSIKDGHISRITSMIDANRLSQLIPAWVG